jgi:hypothetical protein
MAAGYPATAYTVPALLFDMTSLCAHTPPTKPTGEHLMRSFYQVLAVLMVLGIAQGCMAQGQPYNDGYSQRSYADGYYGAEDYGYCDEYGCPNNYWDQPIYYGSVFYDNAWADGPFYYRNLDGRREYWIHGGWRGDAWRGERPARYRNGTYGPARDLNWYRTNRVYRHGSRHGGRPPAAGNRDNVSPGRGYAPPEGRRGAAPGEDRASSGRPRFPAGSPANVPPADRGHMSFEDRKAAARDEGLTSGGVRPPGYDEQGHRRH